MIEALKKYSFLKKLEQLPFVDEIWLYGSRARGDNQERSDIDLAIISSLTTREDWHKVLEIIEDADTLLHIDCVHFNRLKENDPLKKNILEDKVILYKRENDGKKFYA